jgi:hypothetical protein
MIAIITYVFHHERGVAPSPGQLPPESELRVQVRVFPVEKFLDLVPGLKGLLDRLNFRTQTAVFLSVHRVEATQRTVK